MQEMAALNRELITRSCNLMLFVLVVLFPFIWVSCVEAMAEVDPDSFSMDEEEVEAIYRVLEGINQEIDWRSMFPGNPCIGGPHGVNCDIFNDTWHVVELNLGWVSDTVNNPPCNHNATMDPALFQFPHLRKLFFYHCFTKLPTPIPLQILKLASSLQHLAFHSNPALVGEIPIEVGKLIHLQRLVLTENCLTGFIPEEIGNLKKLQQLVLSRNQLTGIIPNAIKHLNDLKILDLSNNNLTGGIPSSLCELNQVEKLDLSENLLSGNIPFEIGNMVGLQFLDLSSNSLNGSIPDSFQHLRNLEYLILSANLLGGHLQEFWGSLSNLIFLELENNRLVGRIPSSLGKLSALYHLNLSFNMLTGPILFSLHFLSSLKNHLSLQNNSGLCYVQSSPDMRSMSSLIGLVQCSNSSSSSSSNIVVAGTSFPQTQTPLASGCMNRDHSSNTYSATNGKLAGAGPVTCFLLCNSWIFLCIIFSVLLCW